MKEKKEPQPSNNSAKYTTAAFLTMTLATLGVLRTGNYRAALRFYPKIGGCGLNLYKQQNDQLKRIFAIDYHPFWDKTIKQYEWKLHYHRGENINEMKKHRPYQGW